MAEASTVNVRSLPVHLSGLTKVCFSPDGLTIFTGGTDCLVRIHKADDPDSEPGFHDNHTDAITSLACSDTHLITASLDNIARSFSYPQNDFTGYITRSPGVAIRWVSIDPKGERVAICGDDLLVKIVHVNDTERVTLLSDSTKSVRSASWDPTGKYLVTASCDGKLRIYDTESPTPVLLKIMEGVIGSSEADSNVSCYAVWHPSGAYFAIPTRTNDIGIINREGWTKGHTYVSDGPKTGLSELAWSPNGKYLIASAGPQILAWSTDSRSIASRYTNPEGDITGLSFSPTSNLIAFTSLEGSFARWTNAIPSTLPDPIRSYAIKMDEAKLDRLLDDDFGDDVDEDLEDKGDDVDELYGDAGDWIVDDDGTYGVEDGEKTRGGRTEVVNVTKAQEPFTPGSTLLKNKKRYLAFNMIGVVDVTDQETHNVVNVEFHDKSTRRGYHFQDHTKYTMASLGEQGIVYAAPIVDGQASTVYYRPYDSWASQADWTISLLPGESAQSVAAGGEDEESMGSVIVGTTRGLLRFFSSSGIQRYVWRLGEDTVTMAASKEMVIVVHREGGTSLDGCQNLRYTLIDLETFELVQEGKVPLPKRTTLTWIGFTGEGSPAIFDSTGLLSILDRFRRPNQARWVPILDSNLLARKQERTESYWPVGVTDNHFTCVILKGSEKEPWFPRPLIQQLDMHMPLINMDNQQGKLEESVIRGQLQLNVMNDSMSITNDIAELEMSIKQREVALDKELLQLVQGACKADNLARALDLTRLMHNPATLDAAAKVAAFYHLPGLQERIIRGKQAVELKRMREGQSRRSAKKTNANGAEAGPSRGFSDFAPKASRRSFGGVAPGAGRDSTPALSGRSMETFIPETPEPEGRVAETPGPGYFELSGDRSASPEAKRKREAPAVEPVSPPRKRAEDTPVSNGGAKNPFAKKPQASNPFAKPAVAKPLDAIKSTSFFDRVDDIESSGVKGNAPKKAKKDKTANGHSGSKQQTLFGMKKTMPPPPRHMDSTTSTETEGDDEETQGDQDMEETQTDERHILEESTRQDRLSPDWPDEE